MKFKEIECKKSIEKINKREREKWKLWVLIGCRYGESERGESFKLRDDPHYAALRQTSDRKKPQMNHHYYPFPVLYLHTRCYSLFSEIKRNHQKYINAAAAITIKTARQQQCITIDFNFSIFFFIIFQKPMQLLSLFHFPQLLLSTTSR